MLRKLLVVGIVGAIGFAGVQASAFAKASADTQQSQQGTEQQVLRRLATQPRDLTAQLDLIRIYLDTNRLAEAELLLTRALNQVREQRVIAQQPPIAPSVAPRRRSAATRGACASAPGFRSRRSFARSHPCTRRRRRPRASRASSSSKR